MLEKFHDALLANDDILFFDEEFCKFRFFMNEMGILSVYLDKINLNDDNNFHEDDPETTIHVRLITWRNEFKKCKAFKKYINKELMPVACHLTRWWDWCLSEDEKKGIESVFTAKVEGQNCF